MSTKTISSSQRAQWFARNEEAEALEEQGQIEAAMSLYRENVREGCDTAYTYERMAALYRNQGEVHLEIPALEKALMLEKARGGFEKAARLEERLALARDLHKRNPPKQRSVRRETLAVPTQKKRRTWVYVALAAVVVLGWWLLA